MSRLDILKNSLEKKNKLFNEKFRTHMSTVAQANGQPLNDKRNGARTLSQWDKQQNALRNINEEIAKTEKAIEKEEFKIACVASVVLPVEIQQLIDIGTLNQWRRHPNRFFVNAVDKARIILKDDGTIAYSHLRDITDKEQYAKFRDVYNNLANILNKKV